MTAILSRFIAKPTAPPVFPDGGLCFDIHGGYVSPTEYLESSVTGVDTLAATTNHDLTVQVITQRFIVGRPGVGDGARYVIETCVSAYSDPTKALAFPTQYRDEKTARTRHDEIVTAHGGAFVRPRTGAQS